MKRFALVVAILALGVSSLNASTVNFRLKYNGVAKTWNLYGMTSGNEGLSLFGVVLTNVGVDTSGNGLKALKAPKVGISSENPGFDPDNSDTWAPRGFNNSAQVVAVGTGYQIGVAQDVSVPVGNVEYGVGITPGIIQAGVGSSAPYDYPVLLATGTLKGAGPFDRNHPENLPQFTEAKANVYMNRQINGVGGVFTADIVTTEVVPEPSTMVLAAFGLLSLVALGFRRSK